MFIATLAGCGVESSTLGLSDKPFVRFGHTLNQYLLSPHFTMQGRFSGITEFK